MEKIDIIYRCCNSEVGAAPGSRYLRPVWFDKIKCLQTFIKSVREAKEYVGKVIFVHDGPKGELFDNLPKDTQIIEINYQDNTQSILETFKIADTLNNDIYFVEDDYVHLPHAIKTIYYGVQNFKLVTGFDHLDRYIRTDDLTLNKESIAFSKKTNCHWRTAESTCCTWACSRELWNTHLKEIAPKFKTNDRDLFRYLYNEHSIRLWTPIPGVTTTCMEPCLSPGTDWEKAIDL